MSIWEYVHESVLISDNSLLLHNCASDVYKFGLFPENFLSLFKILVDSLGFSTDKIMPYGNCQDLTFRSYNYLYIISFSVLEILTGISGTV